MVVIQRWPLLEVRQNVKRLCIAECCCVIQRGLAMVAWQGNFVGKNESVASGVNTVVFGFENPFETVETNISMNKLNCRCKGFKHSNITHCIAILYYVNMLRIENSLFESFSF